MPDEPEVPDEPLIPLLPEVPDEPLTPLLPEVPDDPDVPLLPEVPDEPLLPAGPVAMDVVFPIVFVELLYTNTSLATESVEILSNRRLPDTKTLPVNCPLNCPLKDDKFDTDEETATNVEFILFTELDTLDKISKLPSISAAESGAPFGILFIIAILY